MRQVHCVGMLVEDCLCDPISEHTKKILYGGLHKNTKLKDIKGFENLIGYKN